MSPPGNCFGACIASILEVPLESLPCESDYWEPGLHPRKSWPPYYEALLVFLEKRNLTLVECVQDSIIVEWRDSWCIVSGPSPRDPNVLHAVVGRGADIVHDPHPTKAGLAEGRRTYTYFVVIDPSALR